MRPILLVLIASPECRERVSLIQNTVPSSAMSGEYVLAHAAVVSTRKVSLGG